MFTINWVNAPRNAEPIVTEASGLTNISKLVAALQTRTSIALRVLYTDMPPDGLS